MLGPAAAAAAAVGGAPSTVGVVLGRAPAAPAVSVCAAGAFAGVLPTWVMGGGAADVFAGTAVLPVSTPPVSTTPARVDDVGAAVTPAAAAFVHACVAGARDVRRAAGMVVAVVACAALVVRAATDRVLGAVVVVVAVVVAAAVAATGRAVSTAFAVVVAGAVLRAVAVAGGGGGVVVAAAAAAAVVVVGAVGAGAWELNGVDVDDGHVPHATGHASLTSLGGERVSTAMTLSVQNTVRPRHLVLSATPWHSAAPVAAVAAAPAAVDGPAALLLATADVVGAGGSVSTSAALLVGVADVVVMGGAVGVVVGVVVAAGEVVGVVVAAGVVVGVVMGVVATMPALVVVVTMVVVGSTPATAVAVGAGVGVSVMVVVGVVRGSSPPCATAPDVVAVDVGVVRGVEGAFSSAATRVSVRAASRSTCMCTSVASGVRHRRAAMLLPAVALCARPPCRDVDVHINVDNVDEHASNSTPLRSHHCD